MGYYKNMQRNGLGVLLNTSSRIELKYAGQFQNDYYQGLGILNDNKQGLYNAEFEKGQIEGFSKFISSQGGIYRGFEIGGEYIGIVNF